MPSSTTTPTPTARSVRAALRAVANPTRAKGSANFFKCGPGQYGEGDIFIGVDVPTQRRIAKQHAGVPLPELAKLLASPIHEDRLTALIILAGQYKNGDTKHQLACFKFYLRHLPRVNNWDLVDLSADRIVGAQLLNGDRRLLDRLVKSKDLWERRVAIIATFAFIRAGESKDTFRLALALAQDEEDLLHKASGWMLREVGKRVGEEVLRGFLRKHARSLPRTTLRYAIERFPEKERRAWLVGSRKG